MRPLNDLVVISLAAAGVFACSHTVSSEPLSAESTEEAAEPASTPAPGSAPASANASPPADAPPPGEASATEERPVMPCWREPVTHADVKAMMVPVIVPAPDDVAVPPANAEKTASGLESIVLTPGTGKEHPTDYDRISVRYAGWTRDGKMFKTSKVNICLKFTMDLSDAAHSYDLPQIKGWTEGVKLMTKGEKRRFWIPADLAYGDIPKGPDKPAGPLTFDIELVDIKPLPKAPADVAKPPAKAKHMKSGLAYRVLTPGTGKEHPGPTSQVTVNYTGWTTDGKMFDSSVERNRSAKFHLDKVLPGWTEGVQLMVVGEKTRFWIPEDLAYKGREGAPAGTLVFDIELVAIE